MYLQEAKRNSSIELLKVIAMFIIVISHSLPRYGFGYAVIDFESASSGIDSILMFVEFYFGQIGNAIFIVCSSWFLLDSKHAYTGRIKNIIIDTWVFSICWLIILLIFDFDFSVKTIIKQFLPITFENNWFIGCYIVFYVLHPIMNKTIENISKKMHLEIALCGVILYSVIEFICKSERYCDLMGFLLIYFIVGYMKKYMKKFINNIRENLLVFLISSICLLMIIITTNELGLHMAMFSDKMLYWCRFTNLFIILMALSVFNIFMSKIYYNKLINEISSVTLLIYVIHENTLFRDNVKPLWWEYIHFISSWKYLAGWTVVFAVICLGASVAVALLYKKTLRKIFYRVSDFWFDKMCNTTLQLL